MLVAARWLAKTATDLFADPSIVEAAQRELVERRGRGYRYEPMLGDREPPLDYRR